MFVPVWLLVIAAMIIVVVVAWLALLLAGRNPLPFPDGGSRIFAAPSAEAKAAVIALLGMHGLRERFQVDTESVRRSILWDGTIINVSSEEVTRKLGGAGAGIGIVARDPIASAGAAADFLRERGFQASVVLDAEPDLGIAFVTTNALSGAVLNFRKHVIRLPRPK